MSAWWSRPTSKETKQLRLCGTLRSRTHNMQGKGIAESAKTGMQSCEPCFPLLSLPQPALMVVVQCVGRKYRKNLFSVCRSLARAVSELHDTQVIVTPSTNWEGLCKVLATRIVICKSLWVFGADASRLPRLDGLSLWGAKRANVGDTAISILLKPGAFNFSFPGIRRVLIEVHPLPCLLPSRLASLLPDLEELEVDCGSAQFTKRAHIHPIPYCSTLRRIRCVTTLSQLGLPRKYHTSEDLRRQLPNVVSVETRWCPSPSPSIFPDAWKEQLTVFHTLVNAWSDQLTELLFSTDVPQTALLQHCTRLQSLKWNADSSVAFATIFPQTLTTLPLTSSLSESQLPAILQLPQLRVLNITSFLGDLQHDWSKDPCSWQQLIVHSLPMTHLSKLPLHSLKGQGCLNIEYLVLPDALLADSLPNLEHAVQCVREAGIMVEGFCDWDFKLSQHHQEEQLSEVDKALAELVHTACTVLSPRKSHEIRDARYRRVLQEMIKWMSATVEDLQMPWLWALLSHCDNLVRVTFPCPSKGNKYAQAISELVTLAVKSYVEVTDRPITLIVKSIKVPGIFKNKTRFCLIKLQQKKFPASAMLDELAWKTYINSESLIIRLKPRKSEHSSNAKHVCSLSAAEHMQVQMFFVLNRTYACLSCCTRFVFDLVYLVMGLTQLVCMVLLFLHFKTWCLTCTKTRKHSVMHKLRKQETPVACRVNTAPAQLRLSV